MSLWELDPNIVKPGWTPLLILLALGVVMALLFRSMRRQFRRVDDHWPQDAAAAAARRGAGGSAPTDQAPGSGQADSTTVAPADPGERPAHPV